MERQFVAYIRVSTTRQGEHGVSLQEQQDAIRRYAQRFNLDITQWFEERETAAKRGRPIFSAMIGLLRRGKARGVILHKIDRGARNLKDWADLGELIDIGIEVHCANESLDLHTRGGRLSADIQAVVAADFIRNLREETKKGFYGRLKQGLYPMAAPVGYRDRGGGQPKDHDPIMGPLIAQAFQLYATGQYSLPRLADEMYARGLRNRRRGPVTVNGLSTVLNNPFYIGLIRIKKTSEVFAGIHPPLTSKRLFDGVQKILEGKTVNRLTKHDFTFRRMVKCRDCGYSLIGEQQKGRVYYRCHTIGCATKTIREDSIDSALAQALLPLRFEGSETKYVQYWFKKARPEQERIHQQAAENCRLQLDQIRSRISRLTDAYIDGAVERTLFEERKAALVFEEAGVKEKIQQLEAGYQHVLTRLEKFLELAKSASDAYKTASPDEKRELVKKLTSNFGASDKNPVVVLKDAPQLLANRPLCTTGSPKRGTRRTWDRILKKLLTQFSSEAEAPG